MNKTNLQPLKGFRDFYPADMAFQRWLYQIIKETSESFGFSEYEGPTVESLDLYAAKSGEELVKKQAFTWTDKAERQIALRPEMTPSLARMVAQKEGQLVFPIKWFTYGRRFRYEAPQTGRGREFFQWDIDILGPANCEADAEIISIAANFYKKLGLTPNEVKIKINDRQFLQESLKTAGVAQGKLGSVIKIIDKKDKVDETEFTEMLQETGLNGSSISKITDLLADKEAYKKSEWLTKIFDYINLAGLAEYIEYDPSIVRGLDYYTRTVFEGWDVVGGFRAIWGGGRYDNLTSDIGSSQKIPGVGFAMGDMVLELVLRANNKYPTLNANNTKVLVTVFSPELMGESLSLSLSFRSQDIPCELYPDPDVKLDRQLKYADKKGIPIVAIIGPDEAQNNTVTIKNLQTKEQKTLTIEEAINQIQNT